MATPHPRRRHRSRCAPCRRTADRRGCRGTSGRRAGTARRRAPGASVVVGATARLSFVAHSIACFASSSSAAGSERAPAPNGRRRRRQACRHALALAALTLVAAVLRAAPLALKPQVDALPRRASDGERRELPRRAAAAHTRSSTARASPLKLRIFLSCAAAPARSSQSAIGARAALDRDTVGVGASLSAIDGDGASFGGGTATAMAPPAVAARCAAASSRPARGGEPAGRPSRRRRAGGVGRFLGRLHR